MSEPIPILPPSVDLRTNPFVAATKEPVAPAPARTTTQPASQSNAADNAGLIVLGVVSGALALTTVVMGSMYAMQKSRYQWISQTAKSLATDLKGMGLEKIQPNGMVSGTATPDPVPIDKIVHIAIDTLGDKLQNMSPGAQTDMLNSQTDQTGEAGQNKNEKRQKHRQRHAHQEEGQEPDGEDQPGSEMEASEQEPEQYEQQENSDEAEGSENSGDESANATGGSENSDDSDDDIAYKPFFPDAMRKRGKMPEFPEKPIYCGPMRMKSSPSKKKKKKEASPARRVSSKKEAKGKQSPSRKKRSSKDKKTPVSPTGTSSADIGTKISKKPKKRHDSDSEDDADDDGAIKRRGIEEYDFSQPAGNYSYNPAH